MHDYLLSLFLGVVEGLTEFLPVSSTAHLRIAQALCGLSLEDEYWKMFAIVIQLGAILAVVVYFWKRLVAFVRTFPNGAKGTTMWYVHPLTLVMIAFVVTAGPAYLLTRIIKHNLESPYIMAGALIIGGVIMWVVDAAFRKPKITEIEQMGVIDAIWIGAVQILSAVFPGTSRSMSTIAAGQVFGMSRQAALEFSFFLSVPTMVAATLSQVKPYILPGKDPTTQLHLTGDQWGILLVGTVVSFIVALGVIAWFMNWVRKHGFIPFAVYRILAGAAVLWMIHAGMLAAN